MRLVKITNNNTLHIFEEIITVDDVNNSYKNLIKVFHHVSSINSEISSYIEDKKVLNTKIDIDKNNSFFDNSKKFILSNKIGQKAVKAALALAISTGLSISAHGSEYKVKTQIEQKHNIAKNYVLENIQESLVTGAKKARQYNQEKGLLDKDINKDIEKSINIFARIIELETPVNAEAFLDKKEVNIYLSKQALNEITTIEQSKEILKIVENMALHEYQHILTYSHNKTPLEKYAVEAQQKYAHRIDYSVFPESIINRDNNHLKNLFSNQMQAIKNKIENISLNKDTKENFNQMIKVFEYKYKSRLETMNSSKIFGKREVDLSNLLPMEYLSTTMKNNDFQILTKDLSETEKFVLSRQSALISHLMPVELAKENFNYNDIKELVSLSLETEERYKENTNLLKSEKSFFNDTLIEDFKNTKSEFYNWLNKEFEDIQQKEHSFKDVLKEVKELGDKIENAKDISELAEQNPDFADKRDTALELLSNLSEKYELINLSDNQIDNLKIGEAKAVNLAARNEIPITSKEKLKEFMQVIKNVANMSLEQNLDFNTTLNKTLEKMSDKFQKLEKSKDQGQEI